MRSSWSPPATGFISRGLRFTIGGVRDTLRDRPVDRELCRKIMTENEILRFLPQGIPRSIPGGPAPVSPGGPWKFQPGAHCDRGSKLCHLPESGAGHWSRRQREKCSLGGQHGSFSLSPL